MKTCNSQNQFVTEVLVHKVIDSDICVHSTNGYNILAHQYLQDEFKDDGQKRYVHHLDFNHFNNVLNNIVVLTKDEHDLVHHLYDKAHRYYYKNTSKYYTKSLCRWYSILKDFPPEQCLECEAFKRMKRDEELRNS